MNWSDHTSPESPLDALIEPFLDGALSPEERERVLAAVSRDPDFAREVKLARSIREALRSMPSAVAPPDLAPSVMRVARQDRRRQVVSAVWDRVRALGTVDLRPAFATATLIAVIVTAAIVGRPAQPQVSAEAEAALAQIKWTLALVSEVTERSTEHIRRDVLEPHVVGHMRSAANNVFQDPQVGSILN